MTYLPRTQLTNAVRADIKGRATPQELRIIDSLSASAEGVRTWYRELIAAKVEVELQISQNKARLTGLRAQGLSSGAPDGKERYLAELHRVSDWKVGATRYLRAIEQKLCSVKQLATELAESAGKTVDKVLGENR